jgi:hypothetical protein
VCTKLLNVKKWDGVGTVVYQRNYLGGGVNQEFFSWGFQQIQLRIEGTENGDLVAVAP